MPLLISISWISLALAVLSSAVIAIDVLLHPQPMWIMNIIWPVTALYAGPLAVWAYFRFGKMSGGGRNMKHEHDESARPFAVSVALGATHCGAGCTLGDLIAESAVVFVPPLGSFLFQTRMFNAWVIDFIAAYLFGVLFQYFTIAPMRHLPLGKGIVAAIKADTLSLTAWQIGMYGWMAIATFLIFRHEIPQTSPVFWFMMQIAMLCGFLTSYPVNWWLIRSGIKEQM